MAKFPKDQQEQEFNFRKGAGNFPGYLGQDRGRDPGGIPPSYARMLVNLIPSDGEFVSRGGQTKFDAAALLSAAKISSLYDFQPAKALKLWITTEGCQGNGATGFSLNSNDPLQSPKFGRITYDSSLANWMTIGKFDGSMYVGKNTQFHRAVQIKLPYGVEAFSITGISQSRLVKDFGGSNIVKILQDFDSKLFVALNAGVGSSAIWAHNGVSTVADLTALSIPGGMGLWRENLMLGFTSTTNAIRIRSIGAAPGTWATVAPGAGTFTQVSEGVTYKDIYYAPGGATILWGYDGTSLAAARTLAAGSAVNGVAIFNGLLYYAWTPSGGGARVGKFDGTTWTDTEKDLTVITATLTKATLIKAYRGNLNVTGQRTPGGASGVWDMLTSPGTATTGTWTTQRISDGGSNGPTALLVY